jgi:hypothetical protein
VIYITATGGTTDLRFDVGYNYVDATINNSKVRNGLFLKLITILALRNILGSVAGDNKILSGHFEWYDNTIKKIKQRHMSMTLENAPASIISRGFVVESSFKTKG